MGLAIVRICKVEPSISFSQDTDLGVGVGNGLLVFMEEEVHLLWWKGLEICLEESAAEEAKVWEAEDVCLYLCTWQTDT